MVDLRDIRSLTDFQRNTREFLARIRASRKPVVLTVNGRAALVMQDADAYQEMADALERLETLEAVMEGLEDVRAGRTRPAAEALEELRLRHGIPR